MSTLRFLCVNDVYKVERLSCLKTLLHRHQNTTGATKLILPGDFLGGSLFAATHEGESVVDVMNCLGISYATLGNHEFDFGATRTQDLMDKSNFPWLGSNVRDSQTKDIFHKTLDYDIFEVLTSSGAPIRVGVFGVCTQTTPNCSHPTTAVSFEDAILHSKRCVSVLKSHHCEVICAFTHVSLHIDKKIAEIPHIDVIIGGHDHDPYLFVHHGTVILKCGMDVDYLGLIDIDLDLVKGSSGHHRSAHEPVAHSIQLISTRGAESDPQIDSVISRWNDIAAQKNAGIEDEAICIISEGAAINTLAAQLRNQETAFACMVADAMLHACRDAGCDGAIINGGFVRGNKTYTPGTILRRSNVLEECPFRRKVCIVLLTGAQLQLGLEQMISGLPHPVPCFPHLSDGFLVVYDVLKPPLNRIIEISINGEPIDLFREYKVAVSDFFAESEGDGVSAFRQSKIVIGDLIFNCIISYLKLIGTISGDLGGRMVKA